MDRRRLLGSLGAAGILALLPGCSEDDIKKILDTCPTDPAATGGIDWTPDIGHPLFWGFQDLGTAQGAPRDMLIYYPSLEGSPQNAPIHQRCLTRWPVVLFLHGQPPSGVPTAGYHRKWSLLPSVLARCGYVVVVPNHGANLPDSGSVAAALADLNYVRTSWSNANWVEKRAEMTVVAGHSFGALLAATIANAHPEFGALLSLSGGFHNLTDFPTVLRGVKAPSFFMWAKGEDIILPFEDLDGGKVWDSLPQNKYAAVFQGEHFDYLPASLLQPGDFRGPCDLVGGVAADLAALFISEFVPVPLGTTHIGVDLRSPQVQLTQKQQFYAGAHLQSIAGFATHQGCKLDLRWVVDGATGIRKIGL
jgi:pimeloyl-ACP methyl ester carboxylesterase